MTVTIEELKEIIPRKWNEVDVIEMLDITTEELVEAFQERIEEKYDFLIDELDLEDDYDRTQ